MNAGKYITILILTLVANTAPALPSSEYIDAEIDKVVTPVVATVRFLVLITPLTVLVVLKLIFKLPVFTWGIVAFSLLPLFLLHSLITEFLWGSVTLSYSTTLDTIVLLATIAAVSAALWMDFGKKVMNKVRNF